MLKPLLVMVAGANRVHKWKPKNQAIRASSGRVILWISQKGEFSRGAMEKALGLNTGQAEWHIKELLRKGIIKHTNKYVYKTGKGQNQIVYRYENIPDNFRNIRNNSNFW